MIMWTTLVQIAGTAVGAVLRLLVAVLAAAGGHLGVGEGDEPGGAAADRPRGAAHYAEAVPYRTTRDETARLALRRTHALTVVQAIVGSGAGCERALRVHGTVAAAGDTTLYTWRLLRRSAATGEWQPYLSAIDGFVGEGTRTVEWRTRVVGNPGWYRAELRVADRAPVTSGRFQIAC